MRKKTAGGSNSGHHSSTSAEAIEHREDNWLKRRLLLDVGATDADDTATGHRVIYDNLIIYVLQMFPGRKYSTQI